MARLDSDLTPVGVLEFGELPDCLTLHLAQNSLAPALGPERKHEPAPVNDLGVESYRVHRAPPFLSSYHRRPLATAFRKAVGRERPRPLAADSAKGAPWGQLCQFEFSRR